MKQGQHLLLACIGFTWSVWSAGAQTIASNFVLTDRETQQTFSMTDLAGQIIVLDFFAYWCGPCQASSPLLEQEVAAYYADRNGNPYGIPVRVIPVNIQANADALTDNFVQTYGLSHAADDWDGSTWGEAFWGQFGQNAIPHFVIINGVADSSRYQQWEVLHSNPGFPGSALFRSLINSIDGTPPIRVVAAPRIQEVRRTQTGQVILSIPMSRADERYSLEWGSGDGNWQPVDPRGLNGNGGAQTLTHFLEPSAPPLRLYRVRAVAE